MKEPFMFPPKMTAWAINQAVGPKQKVNLGTIYSSLEQKRGLTIMASHNGIEAWRRGEMVYQDGEYKPEKAVGAEQCARYRLKQVKFLKWALINTPTSELEAIGGWLNAQLS